MKTLLMRPIGVFLLLGIGTVIFSQNASKAVWARDDPKVQAVVDNAVQTTLTKFADKGLKPDEFAVTLIDLTDEARPARGSYRGEEKIYPASVIKLFYLSAVHRWLQEGKLTDTPELRRALKDMIVDSSNDATQYIVDLLTGTTSGVELPPAQMKEWGYKRNAVNRYYQTLGYTNINVNQKTFCEDSYGREREFRGPQGENRNKLTTDATARLLSEISTGKAVSSQGSSEMMTLLRRDFAGTSKDLDDQAHGFTAIALTPGMKLWSKAGWTSETRHDAAYVELPNGRRFVLVTFTTRHANEREIIPTLAREVLRQMEEK
jgi:beta-lactamase class A